MTSIEGENKPVFDINAEARAHGGYLGLPQVAGESDSDYRYRIAGVLRGNGQIIEAHEVSSGRRFNDPEQGKTGPMIGILGAVAQAAEGRDLSPFDFESQVGDDIAVGGTVSQGPDQTNSFITGIFDTFGPDVGMDIIDSLRREP